MKCNNNNASGFFGIAVSSWCNASNYPPSFKSLNFNWWVKNNFALPKHWISLKCNSF